MLIRIPRISSGFELFCQIAIYSTMMCPKFLVPAGALPDLYINYL